MNNLIYRKGSPQDVAQLRQLGIDAYSQFARELTPENWNKLSSFLHDEAKTTELLQQARSFVCSDNNKLVGMAYLVPSGNPWDVFKAEWSYIRMVGVHPDYRGNGIAKKLTQMCIEAAKQNSEKIIALHTSEMMHAARHIYERLGFTILQEIEPRFGKKYWLYTQKL